MKQALNEVSHLGSLNQIVSVLIDRFEGRLELGLVVAVGRRQVCEDSLQEFASLFFVKVTAVVFVKVCPDLVDNLVDDSVTLDVTRQNSGKRLCLLEVRVVEEDLNVAWEALPEDGSLVLERLSIDDADLLVERGGLGRGRSLFLLLVL